MQRSREAEKKVQVSGPAARVLQYMLDNEGFLSMSQARSNQNAVAELLDRNFIKNAEAHGLSGYSLSKLGRQVAL